MANLRILSVGTQSRELATDEVVEAMFTTISCRLEARGSGTRFPAVMEDLHSGYVKPERAAVVLRELDDIEPSLRAIPVSQVVWGLNVAPRDDAGEVVNRGAQNAFDYFVDGSGQPLLERLRAGLQECLARGEVLYLRDPWEARVGLVGGSVCVVAGIAWMFLGHSYFREWCLRRGTARLPIWTVGMDLVMIGIGVMIALMSPGLRDWFRRHPSVLMTIVLSAPIGWLVVCWRAGFLPD
jgi:hypothetical protein